MTPEITTNENQRPKSNGRFIWYSFALLIVFTYFFGLTIPLLGPDEPRYAQVAREMLERRDWITPTLGGFNWFEKPALFYWLEIASYKLFGVSEFAARFGSALFGLGTILSLWILGRNLTTENTENTEKSKVIEYVETPEINSVSSVAGSFANWLALIAASTLGIMVFSRGASFDIIITFPITAALVSFYIWHSRNDGQPDVTVSLGPKKLPSLRRRGGGQNSPPARGGVPEGRGGGSRRGGSLSASLFFFYTFIGIALLAKGLIGIVFPFAIVGFYYLISRKLPTKTFMLSLFWGTLLAVAIAAVWYVPMYLRHGYAFIDEFFIQHHFQRFTSNKFQHPQPFYFFLWVLPLMMLPWLSFFLAAIWRFTKGVFHRRDTETQREAKSLPIPLSPLLPFSSSPLLLFSLAWLLVPLVFFSFSGSKLPGYILPAVPAAIILTTDFVFRFVRKSKARRFAIQLTATGVFAAAIVLMIFVIPKYADSDSVKCLVAAADARGFTNEKILTLHTISHNAEFYAAGRLLRTEDGKLKRLSGTAEVADEVRRSGASTSLVLVPLEYVRQLTASDIFRAEMIKDNGELAIVAVTLK